MPKMKKVSANFTIKKLIIFLVVVALSLITLPFSSTFEKWLNINSAFYNSALQADYTVHFVDVGQGDCTIFEFPNGDIMIVDSGKAKSENAVKNYLETVIFKDRDNKNITYLVATHSDEDHIGNMTYILENYDVQNVFRPKILSKSETTSTGKGVCTTNVYDEFIKAAEAEPNCNIFLINNGLGDVVSYSKNNVTRSYGYWFYGPIQNIYSDVNDYCPFLFVEANGRRTLITGDASSSVEEEIILASGDSLLDRVDVYHCGHHGSNTSTSQMLLDAIEMDYCVISCGKNNSYGHPHAETLKKLNDKGIKILNTAEDGNIIFAYSEDGTLTSASGKISVLDSVRWWMVVLVFDLTFGVILFAIKFKIKKKL